MTTAFVSMEKKLNHANMLKQYVEREVVDTNPLRKDPTIAAAWIVEQDEKSSVRCGEDSTLLLKQKSVLRFCGLCRSFRLTCTGKG